MKGEVVMANFKVDLLPLLFTKKATAHNILVNVRHAWLDECAVRATRKKFELISDGGKFGNKKWK